MTERSQVVFLSYASQDAAAALRIADELRTAGIEVWLDQSQLRGGDAWDRQIRELIRECRLFVAIISANTETRDEGYFRREWRLAVDRTHDMSERKAFLVPVVIDDTPQRGASVPDKFREVQWTYLPAGEKSPVFTGRILRLLSPESGESAAPSTRASSGATPHHSIQQDTVGTEPLTAHGRRGPSAGIQQRELLRSVAVLPFANLSSDREQEYFSDGLTEELINQLAHLRGLRVLARTSSFAFKGKNEDLRVIGQKLSVGYALEGSVRKSGNRLRITAQLVDCANGYHLWSETFDRDLDDVFQIQSDISHSVANALGTTLGVSEEEQLGATRNIQAYERYLRARSLFLLFGPSELQRAIELYREALELDAEFALAWTGLASAYAFATIYMPRLAAKSEGDWADAVERALAIAPGLSASQWAQVVHQIYRHDWAAADRAMKQALALGRASDSSANFSRAVFLHHVGRMQEATRYYEAALKNDPLSFIVSTQLQWALTTTGRDAEAESEYVRSRDLPGDRSGVEHAALQRACRAGLSSDKFKEQMRRFLALDSVHSAFESELPDLTEHRASAQERLNQALDDPACQDSTRQLRISWWAALLEDIDLALVALRRTFIDMHSVLVYAIWLPAYSNVRKDPRFKIFLRDLKLVDYWRASGNWNDFTRPRDAEDFEVW